MSEHGDTWVISHGGTIHRKMAACVKCRPVVVIDPEDRDQVEALRMAVGKNGCLALNRTADMQAALRSLLAPVKPPEPQGLGAVVEDAEGNRWVSVDTDDRDGHLWCYWDGMTVWADCPAVKVLSEGIA